VTPSDPTLLDQRDRMALVETVGSVLWFIMDGFWMLDLANPAKAMVLPTLVVNLIVFRYTRHSFTQSAVVGAMNSWLLMNICWMIGDLNKDPKPIEVARLMFGLGVGLLLLAIIRGAMQPGRLRDVLTHFRRLRM
jgi:hypothetical protein